MRRLLTPTKNFGLVILFNLSLASLAAGYGPDFTSIPAGQKDMMIMCNSDGNYGGANQVDYEFYSPTDSQWHMYRKNVNNDTYAGNDTWQEVTGNYQNQNNGKPIAGAPWFPQSVQFDNQGLVGHNSSGNLLAANFGSGYTGFELYTINIKGDGVDRWSSVYSSNCEAGNGYGQSPLPANGYSQRMAGVSVSPFNDKVAAISYDDGSLWVMDYYGGGTAAGNGTAQLGQTPVANAGVWAGNPRRSDSIAGGQVGKSGTTNATCWLNNNVVAVFNGFGEIVTQDVRAFKGGSNQGDPTRGGNGNRTDYTQGVTMAPTAMNTWATVATGVGSGGSQYCGIVYEPSIDPFHVYCSDTKSSGYTGFLYRVAYDPKTGVFGAEDSWQLPSVGGKAIEPREIAFDSQGNLFISGYHSYSSQNAVVKVTDLKDNWGNNAFLSSSLISSNYGSYTGLDVAMDATILPDINGDGVVNSSDLSLLLSNYNKNVHADPTTGNVVDINNDGRVDSSDLSLLLSSYNKGYTGAAATAVPEPSTLLLLVAGSAFAFIASRRRRP